MSLLRTIRPLEQATIRSRVGRTSQPFTTAAFTMLVRAGAGSRSFTPETNGQLRTFSLTMPRGL